MSSQRAGWHSAAWCSTAQHSTSGVDRGPLPCSPTLQGYRIGAYQLDFSIALNLTTTQPLAGNTSASAQQAQQGAQSSSEVLTLTPSQPLVRDSGKTLSAKLLGDLESYTQVPQLMDNYVLVPAPPGKSASTNKVGFGGAWKGRQPRAGHSGMLRSTRRKLVVVLLLR